MLFIGLLLTCQFALGLHTAISKSVTHDELWHLPVGLINLTQGRFGADNLNPPLTRMWAAVPLAVAGVRGDPTATGPAAGSAFIAAHPDDFHKWYVWGRVFNLVLAVATGGLLARWARELWGTTAAVGVTLLYVTCPNVLAHSSIVTPDAGLMLGCLASLYLFWKWSEQRTWRGAIALGVVVGLTQAAKFTAVLLYPVLGAVWVGLALTGRRPAKDAVPAKGAAWQFPAAVVLSLIVLNAVYLFHGSGRRLGDYAFVSQSLSVTSAALGAWHWLPVPFPQDYLEGLDTQRAIMESPHPVFLDGQWSIIGFPAYYPKTLLYKVPHPLQVLAIVGLLGTFAVRSLRVPFRIHALLWLMTAGLLTTAAGTAMQLGVRYILPLLPLLMLYGGAAFGWIAGCTSGTREFSRRPGIDDTSTQRLGGSLALPGRFPRAVRVVIIAAIVLACGASLRHHPHHLAYFNEYAGGPSGGREHLVDSNIDWGQDLNLVRDFMREHDLPTIGLAYFGTLHPQDLGIEYTVPPMLTQQTAPTFRLPPGWYAVSVNFVMGRPHLVHTPDGRDPPVDINAFGYFRELQPVARLGHSIDVYRVE